MNEGRNGPEMICVPIMEYGRSSKNSVRSDKETLRSERTFVRSREPC